jgi:hypothetical protein
MVHILGQHGVKNYGNLRIWAEGGLVRVEDKRDGSCETLSVRDALLRAQAISELISEKLARTRNRTTDARFYTDEINDMQNLVDDVIAVCKQAREQGEPSDPKVIEDRKLRSPKSIPASDGDHFMKTGKTRPLSRTLRNNGLILPSLN